MEQKIVAFDFDGTLTTRDTLLLFVRHACGQAAFVGALIVFTPLLMLMKLRLIDNGKTKERFFGHFFRGWTLERFDAVCRDFADKNRHLLRPEMMKTLQQAQANGAQVFVVSASIENWVQPFFSPARASLFPSQGGMTNPSPLGESEGTVTVIGTQIEVRDGVLTGRFTTPNCYGPEKVRRLGALLPQRENYHITAYGDSRGDRELLAWADKGIKVKG